MDNKQDDQKRSQNAVQMKELLEKSAEMKARHKLTQEKAEDLKNRTEEFLIETRKS